MTPLPKPSIDTGLGLERMASVIQRKKDQFRNRPDFPHHSTRRSAGREIIRQQRDRRRRHESDRRSQPGRRFSHRRRRFAVQRRPRLCPATDYAPGHPLRTQPGAEPAVFLHETARVVFDIMAPAYPDLKEASAFITNVIENEEVRFSETLDNGLRVLNDALADIRAKGEKRVPGRSDIQTLRHLRLSRGHRPGCGARRGAEPGHERLRCAYGAAAQAVPLQDRLHRHLRCLPPVERCWGKAGVRGLRHPDLRSPGGAAGSGWEKRGRPPMPEAKSKW